MATAAAPPALTARGLDKARQDSAFSEPLVLRVSGLARLNDAKWTATFHDSSSSTGSDGAPSGMPGVLTTQAIQRLRAKAPGGSEEDALRDGDVVRVTSYSCISHANQMRLMAMAVEVVGRADAAAGGGGGGGGGGNGSNTTTSAPAAAANGGAPASPADGGAGGKDQLAVDGGNNNTSNTNHPVTPVRPGSGEAAADGDGKGGVMAAAANGNAPPAPTPGEQPRMTPGSLAAAGLAGGAGANPAVSPGPPPPTALAPNHNTANTSGSNISIPVRAAGRPEPAGVVPIASLNPYESGCTIKAKVVRKNPMRSFSRGGGGGGGAGAGGGGGSSVFSCELADAQGGSIQATFWRDAAERVHPSLQEGRVYYFSRFSVKPSNKAYSAVRNDYELSFDPRGCEVEEAADQQASADAVAAALKATVDAVPLARLPAHVGRKAPVDVVAFVTQVGPLGSVKRKADNAELARRDLVLADSTGKSVVLTVWNALASSVALEAAAARISSAGGGAPSRPMVLQVTNVRVGDYNGCSLSTVMRSELTAEPAEGASAEADALREWWETTVASGGGAAPTFTPLGNAAAAGAEGGGGAGGAGSRRNKITSISEMLVPRGQEPAADAKPTYCTVLVRFWCFFGGVGFFGRRRLRRRLRRRRRRRRLR
jgi:hypothetical protein